MSAAPLLMHAHPLSTVFIDSCLLEDVCNLGCMYCGTETQKPIRHDTLDPSYKYPDSNRIHNAYKRTASTLIQMSNASHTPLILKVSGGELSICKDELMVFLDTMSKHFRAVQILTNGTLFTPSDLVWLCRIPNILLQVSLDGLTLHDNTARHFVPRDLAAVMGFLGACSEQNLCVEINCVITKYNAEHLSAFAEHTCRVWPRFKLFPFPVRNCEQLRCSYDQISGFFDDFARQPAWVGVLPAKVYVRALQEFFQNGYMRPYSMLPCRIPSLGVGLVDHDRLNLCPCSGLQIIGSTNAKSLISALTSRRGPISTRECQSCFSHYDILNLWLTREVSDSEIERLPFAGKVVEVLRQVQEACRSEEAV